MNKLSIIIPHYESTKEIKRLLETIPDKNIEIIIVDDKSSEEEYLVLENIVSVFKENFVNTDIKLVINNEKKNAGTCRNKGIEMATGSFILFADADDMFCEDAFLEVDKYLDSENDIVFFPPTSKKYLSNEEGTRHSHYSNIVNSFAKNKSNTNEMKLRTGFVVPWSKLFRKGFLDTNKIRFDELIVSNDIMFSMKTGVLARKLFASAETIYCVTESKESLTTSNITEERATIRIDVAIKRVQFLKNNLNSYQLKHTKISLNHWVKYLIKNNFSICFKRDQLLRMEKTIPNSLIIKIVLSWYKLICKLRGI